MTLVSDYDRVERAISFIMALSPRQPALSDVARHVGLSEFHFQRLFTRWAGITPKRFAQFLSLEHAKTLLRRSRNLLEASYAAGLSGPGRLHDLFVTVEAVTPGEYRARGRGLAIAYGVHPTPFGNALLASTARGVCAIHFVRDDDGRDADAALGEIRTQWPLADLRHEPGQTRPLARRIFEPDRDSQSAPLPLLLRGTNFQVNVWKALLRIPSGAAVTYEELAEMAGVPRAVRAVGTAVGRNPLVYLVPCHRVIRKSGDFGNYGAGRERKRAILAWESARFDESAAGVGSAPPSLR